METAGELGIATMLAFPYLSSFHLMNVRDIFTYAYCAATTIMFYSFVIESVVLSVYLKVMAVISLQLTSAKSIPTVAFVLG